MDIRNILILSAIHALFVILSETKDLLLRRFFTDDRVKVVVFIPMADLGHNCLRRTRRHHF